MTVKHDCSAKTPDMYGVPNAMPCRRSGTVQRDGEWYCWQHDPEYVAKKATERRADWQAKMDREAAKYTRIARDARLGELVTAELASLLIRLASNAHARADIATDPSASWVSRCRKDAWVGRTLAARIREALAQETNDAKGS